MISWRKTLMMKISYIFEKDCKSKSSKTKELQLEYDAQVTGAFNNTMVIVLPSGERMMVDAEFMKQACQKVIDIGRI